MYSEGGESKQIRSVMEGKLRGKLREMLCNEFPEASAMQLNMTLDHCMSVAFRRVLLQSKGERRVDGRGSSEIRPLTSCADVFPSVHGSSIFKRGDTEVLSTVTLGSLLEAKEIKAPINGDSSSQVKNFMLHYDFPPYCTGNAGNATIVNRRMIGHGNLAERALR